MEIIYIKDGRYDEYESLLLDRDRYRKEAEQALRKYIHVFGEQITAVFKQKVACIERKKMLSYCMIYRNRGESVDIQKVQEQIKRDMVEYMQQLGEMIADNEACKNMKTIPEHYVMKIRQIYRRIAKKLHPDMNPLTAQHEELMELWQRNVTAYNCNDLKELEEIEVLVDKVEDNIYWHSSAPCDCDYAFFLVFIMRIWFNTLHIVLCTICHFRNQLLVLFLLFAE